MLSGRIHVLRIVLLCTALLASVVLVAAQNGLIVPTQYAIGVDADAMAYNVGNASRHSLRVGDVEKAMVNSAGLAVTGAITADTVTSNKAFRTPSVLANKRMVFFDNNPSDDEAMTFTGMGSGPGQLRHFVDIADGAHVFFAGGNEIGRLDENGLTVNGLTMDQSDDLKKIVLYSYESDYSGFGIQPYCLTYGVPSGNRHSFRINEEEKTTIDVNGINTNGLTVNGYSLTPNRITITGTWSGLGPTQTITLTTVGSHVTMQIPAWSTSDFSGKLYEVYFSTPIPTDFLPTVGTSKVVGFAVIVYYHDDLSSTSGTGSLEIYVNSGRLGIGTIEWRAWSSLFPLKAGWPNDIMISYMRD